MMNAIVLLIGVALTLLSLLLYAFVLRSKREWAKGRSAQFCFVLLFIAGVFTVTWTASSGMIVKEKLDTITFSLAIVAIVFAALQFVDSRAQEFRMNVVVEEMSTRFIGFFPKNLRDINQIATQADEHFEAMSDYVSYGYYSDPDQFDQLVRQLEDLVKRRVQVKMLIYTRGLAQKTYETQFTKEAFAKDLASKDSRLFRFCQRFDRPLYEKLLAASGTSADVEKLRGAFDALMFDRQMFYLKDLIERGVTIRKTTDQLPFFFWCEDGHEAVFSFLHEHSPDEREVSFRTRDSSLVKHTFEKKFNELWDSEAAKPIEFKTGSNNQKEPDWS
jgi:hypothetical protein